MIRIKGWMLLLSAVAIATESMAQTVDTLQQEVLDEVNVSAGRDGMKRMAGAVNGAEIGQDELFRAACCNLGESFVTNPSVDVNYNDAAVGAKQIRLLGLDGQYVQMLCEGLPLPVVAAQPYLLGRVPGSWMRSISVSKGASSVKNGPQGITGQIDVEYLKSDEEQGLLLNFYTDSRLKTEGNLVGNYQITPHLSTELLAHVEKDWMHHDQNGDGWIDLPVVEQYNVSNRWKYRRGKYIGHYGFSLFDETRQGGTVAAHEAGQPDIDLHARGAEAYMKHALLLDPSHNTNLAFMGNASYQRLGGRMGPTPYASNQHQFYGQLMLEHDFAEAHQLSTGLSLKGEHLDEPSAGHFYAGMVAGDLVSQTEFTPGIYAQYTYKPDYRLTAMVGLRGDYSSLFNRFYATPRVHAKWMPADWVSLRASVGKAYRTSYPLAEHHYLVASGRKIVVDTGLPMEEAWNTGVSAVFYIPVGGRTITLSTEYFYTDFQQQVVFDYDSDPSQLHITALDGTSYSHTFQVDATYEPSDEWNLMAAFRLNDVRCTYGGVLLEKPLQSKYKALLTVGWEPMMALWHVDFTLQLNGPGRLPIPATEADGTPRWDSRFPAYPQINLQLTRDFRHCSVYIGGENLTGFTQPVPVIDADNPWTATFDPTMLWGPVHGTMVYAGVRMNFWRM